MSFENHSRVSVRGRATLNNVGGNQINNNYAHTAAQVINYNTQVAAERTEYDEFEYVKRGHIVTVKDIGSTQLKDWHWKWQSGESVRGRLRRCQQTICTIKIYPDRRSKFTAVIYDGDDAHELWERDFQRFSRSKMETGSVQLFGLNRSEVPMLIFHHELIPLGHFYMKSFWSDVYIWHLAKDLDCYPHEMWMDSQSTICRGPEGPHLEATSLFPDKSIFVPSTSTMLEGDASFRFFANFGSQALDNCVLDCAQDRWEFTYLDELLPIDDDLLDWTEAYFYLMELFGDPDGPLLDCEMTSIGSYAQGGSQPDWTQEYPYVLELFYGLPSDLGMNIARGLRFDTVYSASLAPIARWPLDNSRSWFCIEDIGKEGNEGRQGLVNRKLVGDGLTRFTFILESQYSINGSFGDRGFWEGWLAQSSWVIDALEMTGKEDKCFVVLPPSLKLRSIPRAGQYVGLAAFFKLCDSEPPPIYLFIHPAPTCLPELVSWLSGYQPTYFWSFDETGRTQMSDDDCEEWGLPQLYHTHHISSIQLRTWPDNVYKALRDWQIARGYDTATADFARHLGYPELEIIGPPKKTNAQSTEVQDNVAKLTSSWWEAIAGSGISAFAL